MYWYVSIYSEKCFWPQYMYPKLSPNNGYRWCPLGKVYHLGLEQLCSPSREWRGMSTTTALWSPIPDQKGKNLDLHHSRSGVVNYPSICLVPRQHVARLSCRALSLTRSFIFSFGSDIMAYDRFLFLVSPLASNISIKRSPCDIHSLILVNEIPSKQFPRALHLSYLFVVSPMLTVYQSETLFYFSERLVLRDHPRCVSLFSYKFHPRPESKLCFMHVHTVYHHWQLIKHHGACPSFLHPPGVLMLIVTRQRP